ncbi:MAG TPA: hypothetical protein VKD72_29060 [Gemmataceae bacterium]|nr:hypothetical protein [Gemmataceae bacterium]
MVICPHCGKSYDAPRERVPWWKYDPGGPKVGLGCGTLLLIGIIVAIFSGRDTLESHVSRLESSLAELKKSSEDQSNALRELRKAIEDQRKGGPAKDQ